jgi:hypothetical protein
VTGDDSEEIDCGELNSSEGGKDGGEEARLGVLEVRARQNQ